MSQATVKATRRQLRRAMGVAGVSALAEAQQNIASLASGLQHVPLKSSVDALRTSAESLQGQLGVLNGRYLAFIQQTFYQRLRWLVTGRH